MVYIFHFHNKYIPNKIFCNSPVILICYLQLIMSNSRSGMSQMNGNSNRRHPALNRNNSNEKSTSSSNTNHNLPHDYIIKYINDTWNAVNQELEKNTGSTKYYKEENHNLKDFRPFNLEAFWGRRTVQYYQNQTRHS